MTSLSDPTTARYVLVGTDVFDRAKSRFARFLHAEVAQLGADWLNGPDATPEDYQWKTTARAHTIEDGIETYEFPSVLSTHQAHHLSKQVGDDLWGISPINDADADRDLTISETLALAAELKEIAEFAIQLEPEAGR